MKFTALSKPLTLLLLAISVTFSVSAQEAENVAMIADIEGLGAITIAGESEPVDILVELASGAELSLADDSTLTLFFFASSEEYTYDGPGKILIEEQQPKLLSGKEANTRNLNMTKLAGIAAEDEGGIGLGVLKLRNFEKPKLQLVSPVDTKVLAIHPKFSWLPVAGATTYKFILSNDLGKKITDISLNENSVVLPDDAQLDSGEEYTWEIIAQTSEQTEYRAHAYFSVAEEHISLQVESSRPDKSASFSEKVVYARLLEKLGLKQSANTIWQELVVLKPDSALLQIRTNSAISED
ncbi:MAG: hypothetical protein JKX81_16055 [Arenicella sp.]|nr:hypothetical protein [Arenicella sp.]